KRHGSLYLTAMPRPNLAERQISERAQAFMAGFHRPIVDEVAQAVARDHLVLVGMAQNPYVKKARRLLDEAKLPYTYLEYGSYLGKWKERLAIKLWAGFPTFPMVFLDGTLEGGPAELVEMQR